MFSTDFLNTKFIAVLQVFLAAAMVGLFFAERRHDTRMDHLADAVDQIKKAQDSAALENSARKQEAEDEAPPPPEIKTIGDITAFLDPVFNQTEMIEEKARALAEVDSWIFAPDQETEALALIDEKVAELGKHILTKVRQMDADAIKMPDGKSALASFSQATSLIGFYPVPKDEAKQREFSAFLEQRESTSKKIQELRRLRFNRWAVDEIEKGYKGYHANLATIQKWEDDPKLVQSTAAALRAINPDFLDVSAMELYVGLLKLTNESIDEGHRFELSKLINNTPKKSPEDF